MQYVVVVGVVLLMLAVGVSWSHYSVALLCVGQGFIHRASNYLGTPQLESHSCEKSVLFLGACTCIIIAYLIYGY